MYIYILFIYKCAITHLYIICLTSLTRVNSDCQLLVCRLIFGYIENQK